MKNKEQIEKWFADNHSMMEEGDEPVTILDHIRMELEWNLRVCNKSDFLKFSKLEYINNIINWLEYEK